MTTETDIVTTEPTGAIVRQPETLQVMDLLQAAVDKEVTVETLERLVALHERVSDRQAAQDYSAAMADFQNACPPIPKTSTAHIASKSGAKYSYTYAELDQIASVIGPLLHARGLSYAWDCEVKEGMLKCVCTVTHTAGHSKTGAFICPIDEQKQMSGPQQYASALTFAQRKSLSQVLGLSTTDRDNDGAEGSDGEPATITDEQVTLLRDMMTEASADESKFLAYLGYDSLEAILNTSLEAALAALEAKLRSKK